MPGTLPLTPTCRIRLMPTSRPVRPTSSRVHPSGDRRFAALTSLMKRHQYRHDALIEVLHTAQQLFGCLEPGLLYFVAHQMKLPPSRVYGVATFYHFFTLEPHGQHTCVVCTGTACYVKGAEDLLQAVRRQASIEAGETTADGRLSLLTARCVGTCGLAPAVVLDGAVAGPQSQQDLLETIRGWFSRGTGGSE